MASKLRRILNLAAVVTVLLIPLSQSLASSQCADQFLSFNNSSLLTPKLPAPGTKSYRALSRQIEQQFEQTGSYAVLDLSKIFAPEYARLWLESLPKDSASQFLKDQILYRENDRHASRAAFSSQSVAIASIQNWFRELIQDAIKRQLSRQELQSQDRWLQLSAGFANLRSTTTTEKSVDFGAWHLDGGGVSVTLAIKGPGTEVLGGVPVSALSRSQVRPGKEWESICNGCEPFVVPEGHALILLGSDAKGQALGLTPTIHRTPEYEGERALLVLRY